MLALRALHPSKTAHKIAAITGSDPRTVERWLAFRAEPRASELVEMLQSEDGLVVLTALMGDARPVWWKRFRRTCSLATARADLETQRRKLERLELEAAE